ncbi:hypothetical protein [Flectobacillus longus]|uniref:hypothetical protein n=1 Tax=Flectobacillus longus TaxID=2984207 RepID=UPI0024B67A63|nr:hypothetical protein [Flectobacillus longus]MDI9879375.1 hypothetical protein [Flectobacillus longus]
MRSKDISLQIIKQLEDVLSCLNVTQYTKPLAVFNGSSLGQHVRHTVEFFQCLIEGLESGIVDYDARKRDMQIENDLAYTLTCLNNISAQIFEISDAQKLMLIATYYDEIIPEMVISNVQRELVYLIEHSIHHFALVRIGIQENFPGVSLPYSFGVAYSTIKYRESVSA